MGFVHVDLGLSNPSDPARVAAVKAMVDTGATLSVFPAAVLEGLGIPRLGQRRLRGFGGVITRATGGVNMSYGGVTAAVTVIFGEEGDPTVMGVTALEVLGFNVNPVAEELTQVDTLI